MGLTIVVGMFKQKTAPIAVSHPESADPRMGQVDTDAITANSYGRRTFASARQQGAQTCHG
jgi:hypothetical protein